MKKRIVKGVLTLAVAVIVLCGGVWFGYSMGVDPTPDEDKPRWQRVIEEEVYPLVTAAASSALAYYIITLSGTNKIKAAAAKAELSALGFDGAAVNLAQVTATLDKSTKENEALRGEIAAMRESRDKDHELLLAGLKMIGLGFSHESELVKNGAAREIMRIEEEAERHEAES